MSRPQRAKINASILAFDKGKTKQLAFGGAKGGYSQCRQTDSKGHTGSKWRAEYRNDARVHPMISNGGCSMLTLSEMLCKCSATQENSKHATMRIETVTRGLRLLESCWEEVG